MAPFVFDIDEGCHHYHDEEDDDCEHNNLEQKRILMMIYRWIKWGEGMLSMEKSWQFP